MSEAPRRQRCRTRRPGSRATLPCRHRRAQPRLRAKRSRRCSANATSPQWMCACSTTMSRLANWKPWATKSTFIQSVRTEQFDRIDFTFFAGDAECTRKTWKTARNAGSAIIDLSSALEDAEGASVRSLWIERERGQIRAAGTAARSMCHRAPGGGDPCIGDAARGQGRNNPARCGDGFRACLGTRTEGHGRTASADREPAFVPAACRKIFTIRRWRSIWQPAWARILSRRWILLRPGCCATTGRLPEKTSLRPSIMLLQAPVFHGQALALFLEMDRPADVAELSQALAGDHVSLPGAEDDLPQQCEFGRPGEHSAFRPVRC